MQLFVLSTHCTSNLHCGVCRNKEGGRKFRQDVAQQFEVPDNIIDFTCPYGKDWIDPSTIPAITLKKKTAPNYSVAVSSNQTNNVVAKSNSTPAPKCGSCSRAKR